MNNGRPKIAVPYQTIDLVIELINITLLLLIIGYTIINYAQLPESVATHFNFKGEPDSFGHKATIWLIPGIAIFTYALLFIINKYPHMHNYLVNITEENALKNYRLSTRIVRFANLFCLIVFGLVTIEIVERAMGSNFSILGIPFLILTLGVPVVGLIFVFIYMKKINKS